MRLSVIFAVGKTFLGCKSISAIRILTNTKNAQIIWTLGKVVSLYKYYLGIQITRTLMMRYA